MRTHRLGGFGGIVLSNNEAPGCNKRKFSVFVCGAFIVMLFKHL
jgi:hypothetical protein